MLKCPFIKNSIKKQIAQINKLRLKFKQNEDIIYALTKDLSRQELEIFYLNKFKNINKGD